MCRDTAVCICKEYSVSECRGLGRVALVILRPSRILDLKIGPPVLMCMLVADVE